MGINLSDTQLQGVAWTPIDPPDFALEPDAVAAGWPVALNVPNRTGMLRGAGNAIVPELARIVFEAIKQAEAGR